MPVLTSLRVSHVTPCLRSVAVKRFLQEKKDKKEKREKKDKREKVLPVFNMFASLPGIVLYKTTRCYAKNNMPMMMTCHSE